MNRCVKVFYIHLSLQWVSRCKKANINLKSVHWINVCVRVLSVTVLLYLCNQSLKSTNLKPDVFKFIIFWSCSLEMSAYTSDTADIYLCFCCAHKSEDIWCRLLTPYSRWILRKFVDICETLVMNEDEWARFLQSEHHLCCVCFFLCILHHVICAQKGCGPHAVNLLCAYWL